MNNETEAPKRIWAIAGLRHGWGDGHCSDTTNEKSAQRQMATEYTRADLSDAQAARIAELEAELRASKSEAGMLAFQCGAMSARADEVEAKLAKAEKAVTQFVYETTSLSQCEDDGSHWCRITRECLANGRATLAELKGT